MIIHFVLFKLKNQPGATPEQLEDFKEKARREIAEALGKVSGPFVPMQFGPPLLPERAKGYDFALLARFKDRKALDDYAVSPEHLSVVNDIIRPRAELEETIDYDLQIPDDAW
ncbi:unnamed protein product [Rhizoctonia solani]|uniref:Stress-response A/B barrel domain-containing protein n=1 Tax=Rhizoctonia solani TaxID=456999 RepID=A0A8H3B0X1_9AGAM|nr:unnamed protein product [Rhizoctonia solani]CAE6519627.1 unnamed protein product [Rhizoctonia solani]